MGIRVELADGLSETRRRHLDGNPGGGDRFGSLLVQLLLETALRPGAEDLDEIRVREGIEEPRFGGGRELVEIAAPRVRDPDCVDQTGSAVDTEAVDEMDGPEQVVPGVTGQQPTSLVLAAALVVDLEPELHRQPAVLRLEDGIDVVV